jgi:hypothetical protein
MSNAFKNFLGQVFNSSTLVKDYSHASRLYVDDFYRLAPKVGFLYYVILNINTNLKSRYPILNELESKTNKFLEIGLLVKNVDLPKFKIETEVVNQYNRKTVIQKNINYQSVSFAFHDDHNNTTNGLWKAYYNYYYADGVNKNGLDVSELFADTKYKNAGANINESTSYGLNNRQTEPFFKSIDIFQLNRKQFTGFRLVNPLISDWTHDKLDQSESKLLENKMTINYETVLYATGKVKVDDPAGFATIHYDTVPGALSIFGNGNNSILGPGGIVSGAQEIFGSAGQGGLPGLLKTAKGGSNLIRNLKNVSKSSVLSEAKGILNDVARTGKLPSVLGGSSAGLNLATLPGEKPTKALSPNQSASIAGRLSASINRTKDSITDGAKNLGAKLKNLLPAAPTPNDIVEVKAAQVAFASELSQQITRNLEIKNEVMPQIAAARDTDNQDAVDEIYSRLDSLGYSDPSPLIESLNAVNENIRELDLIIEEFAAAEIPNSTIGIDTTELSVAPEDVFNVAENPDLNNQINRSYSEETGSVTPYY